MGETIFKINGVKICTEAFGNPDHPAVLLIMGATASMVWWDAEFCQKLAGKGFFVIRYDNRDVGRSTTYEPQTIHYTFSDLVDDAFGVLDSYHIQKAHFAGMSLGGMIAQVAALRQPGRVLTVTCLSSGIFEDDPSLPSIDPRIIDFQAKAIAEVNWEDKQSVADYLVSGWRLLNGSKHPFLEDRAYQLAHMEIERANNLLSMFNHALLKGGEEYYGKTSEIKAPVLIIHGTEDLILPYPHALAIKKALPDATLITLEGVGHEIHFNEWDFIVDRMAAHFTNK